MTENTIDRKVCVSVAYLQELRKKRQALMHKWEKEGNEKQETYYQGQADAINQILRKDEENWRKGVFENPD